MEVFIGRFALAEDQSIFPEDTDDFYDMEEFHKCHYVKVNNQVYKFWSLAEVDEYGFQIVLPSQDGPMVICYWYNGGAGLHEVVESAIKNYLDSQP
jgi:hypothetical protein